MRIIYITCIGYIIAFNSYGQQDSILLQPVDVTAGRLDIYAIADKITPINAQQLSLFKGKPLAQLLKVSAPINIRAYGLSGLSTASMRGTGSNHTAVIWEGLNLQSQMNGSLDLNLVPAIMVDHVTIQSGGSSTLFGSGALGGTIQLGNSTPDFNSGLSLTVNELIGSYGHENHSFKVSASNDKIFGSIRAFYQVADNEFSFYNEFTREDEVQQNAGVLQTGALGEFTIKIIPNQQISSKYWYQYNSTQIPKTASAGQPSNAFQNDITHRGIVKYQGDFKALSLDYKLGFLDHVLDYDDQINTYSHNHSTSVISELLIDYSLSDQIALELGNNYTSEFGQATNFGTNQKRDNLAIFLASNIQPSDKLAINLSARQTFINGDTSPFLPSLGIRYELSDMLALKSRIAKSFRAPTFNDLYWYSSGSALGNPDLKSENGLNSDLGLEVSISDNKINYEATVFYNHINDWIAWQEIDGIWTPINTDELWSYGIEQSTQAKHDFNGYSSLSIHANYQYVVSTIDEPSTLLDNLQSRYTPIHQGNAFVQYQFKKFSLSLTEFITGKQYTDDNNTEIRAIDSYALTDLSVGYRTTLYEKHVINMNFSINNLFDQAYEVRRAYYMPGINYQFNLVYRFN